MKVLILSAHVDDAEIGMGGTINKMIVNDKHEIRMIALSSADDSLPVEYQHGTLAKEAYKASEALGVNISRNPPIVLDYETRFFPRDRQEILQSLIQIRKGYDPDIVYCPNYNDMHQDHAILAREAMRAYKYRTILMYQMPWNSRDIKLQYFSVLTKSNMRAKIKALNEFKSQRKKRYMGHNSIISMASTYGVAIDVDYAEVFQVVRYIDG